MPEILHFTDRSDLMESLAGMVAELLAAALESNGRATLAVPGGTTPAPFLKLLSKADLDWPNVSVMLTDERFVPESSDRSNTRLLRETLLQNHAAAARFLPMYAPADQPEDVLDTLEDVIRAALPIDVCVLGMGADMHTASLFPGADKLAEGLAEGDTILLPMRAPNAPEPRITLTAPVLRGARNIFLLITGADKRAALDVALTDGPVDLAPVRAILHAETSVKIAYAP